MFATRVALGMLMAITAILPTQNALATEFRLPDPNDYCHTPSIVQRLKTRVDHKFRGYTKTKLFLVEVMRPKEKLATERDETHTVDRKWCHAKARMNDGKIRDMWYVIEKPWGFTGFCIAGLDPWHIYGKDCSTIRNSIGWETGNDG
jgi:hypothetical protein